MNRANEVSRGGYGTVGAADRSVVGAWALAIAAVAALAVVFGLISTRGADANDRFDGRIVPVMVVSSDYQARADDLNYKSGYNTYLRELDTWFTWSTGGLVLDRVEPQYLSVPYTNHQLWCSDLRVGIETPIAGCTSSANRLESNIDHLMKRDLGLALRPKTIGAGSPAPWVAVWGGAGYAGEPMVGESAFYVWMNGGSCDGLIDAFPGQTTSDLCTQNPRGSWVGTGLGSSLHELAHQTWDLSHPTELATELARPVELRTVSAKSDGQLMENPGQYPASGWADYEVAMMEQLNPRYVDLHDPWSAVDYIETSTYVTGSSKPAFPVTPSVRAIRSGSKVSLQLEAPGAPAGTTYRIFAFDADHVAAGQHVPVVASTTATNLEVSYRHAACFLVMAWSPNHRPSMPSERWDACLDRDPALVSSTNRAPSLSHVSEQQGRVGEAVTPLELSARDRDGDAIEIIVRNLPNGLRFDPATRTITGVPVAIGTNVVDVAAEDGRGRFVTRQFNWNIESSNALTFNPTTPPAADDPGDVFDDSCGSPVQHAADAELKGVVRQGSAPFDGRIAYASIDDGAGDFYRFDGRATESSIRFCATVSTPGRFVIFASTIAPDTKSDSFFVQIDGGEAFPWHIPGSTVWRRTVVRQPASGPLVLDLEAGDHVFEFFHREDGVKLELFELARV